MRVSNELGELQAELTILTKENVKLKQLTRDLRTALEAYADPVDIRSGEMIELLARAVQLL